MPDPKRHQRGRSYAQELRVLQLDLQPNLVAAHVLGSGGSAYSVRLDQWPVDQLLAPAESDALLSAAKLLDPKDLDAWQKLFAEYRLAFFPIVGEEIDGSCSCRDGHMLCKHVIAVWYVFGRILRGTPAVLPYLWGMPSVDRTMIAILLRPFERLAAKASADSNPEHLPTYSGSPPLPDGFLELKAPLPTLEAMIEGAPFMRPLDADAAPQRHVAAIHTRLVDQVNDAISDAGDIASAWLMTQADALHPESDSQDAP